MTTGSTPMARRASARRARIARAVERSRTATPRLKLDPEWRWAIAGAVLAAAGWIARGPLLALAGALLALTAVLLWLWGRECLTGVRYARTLERRRATFGEHVGMDVELVNDKVLPLTWLHVREEVSSALPVHGAEVVASGWRRELQFVLPMLPFQRVRRHLTVVCSERGEHRFGPAEVRSGSPVGSRVRSFEVYDQASLLVYPKIFTLAPRSPASRLPIGTDKALASLAADPVRVRGVRSYQPGDPVRDLDWRATARRGDLLVRLREPASALRVALVVDLTPPGSLGHHDALDVVELTVAVAASLASELASRGVPAGLYATGTARGRTVAWEPAAGPGALEAALELLALVQPSASVPPAVLLSSLSQRARSGTSVVVVGSDFAVPTMTALSELGRRGSVTTLFVATPEGRPPAGDLVDAHWAVPYDPNWRECEVLDLAS